MRRILVVLVLLAFARPGFGETVPLSGSLRFEASAGGHLEASAFPSTLVLGQLALGYPLNLPPPRRVPLAAQGHYSLDVPPGLWLLSAFPAKGLAYELPLAPLRFGQQLPPLQAPEPKRLDVDVKTSTGLPIAGARVAIVTARPVGTDPWRPVPRFGVTSQGGSGSFLVDDEEVVDLCVTANGYTAEKIRTAVRGKTRLAVTLNAATGITLELRRGNEPAPNVLVFLRDADCPVGFTDPAGQVQVYAPAGTGLRFLTPAGELLEDEIPGIHSGRWRVQLGGELAITGAVLARKGLISEGLAGAYVFYASRPGDAVISGPGGDFKLATTRGIGENVLAWAPGFGVGERAVATPGARVKVEVFPVEKRGTLKAVASNGDPLPRTDVGICLRPAGGCYQTRTDTNGQLPLLASLPETIKVHLNKDGYLPTLTGLPAHSPPKDLVAVLYRGIQVQGVVLGVDGQPLAGAELRFLVEEAHGKEVAIASSSASKGEFQTPPLPPGPGYVEIRATDHALFRQTFELPAPADGQPLDLGILQLEKAAWLRGRIFDDHGEAIGAAKIWAWRGPEWRQGIESPPRRAADATSDSEGYFEVENVGGDETITLEARAAEHIPAILEGIQVADQQPVELHLARSAKIRLRVLGPAREKIGLTPVWIQDKAVDTLRLGERILTTDENGEAELEVQAGPVEIRVEKTGYREKKSSWELKRGENRLIEIRLSKGASLKGQVVDAEGQPVPGAALHFVTGQEPGAKTVAATSAGPDGDYHVEGLPLGPLGVEITHPVYNYSREHIEISADFDVKDFRLPPRRPIRLEGRLNTTASAAPLGIEVLLIEQHTDGIWHNVRQATADAEGYFVFPELPAGKYQLHVMAGPFNKPTVLPVDTDQLNGLVEVLLR